jgi:hypothetical protein
LGLDTRYWKLRLIVSAHISGGAGFALTVLELKC